MRAGGPGVWAPRAATGAVATDSSRGATGAVATVTELGAAGAPPGSTGA